MKVAWFNSLSERDKETVIIQHGTFIQSSDDGKTVCDTYRLFDFFVAVYFELGKNVRPTISAEPKKSELPCIKKSVGSRQRKFNQDLD